MWQIFHLRGDLVKHQWMHNGKKPYKCNQCDKYFSENWHLLCHQMIHTGVKPYQCNQCDKCYSQKGHLVRHQVMHTGEKQYQCNQCEKYFGKNKIVTSLINIHWWETKSMQIVWQIYFYRKKIYYITKWYILGRNHINATRLTKVLLRMEVY